jgi:hypothetical protein
VIVRAPLFPGSAPALPAPSSVPATLQPIWFNDFYRNIVKKMALVDLIDKNLFSLDYFRERLRYRFALEGIAATAVSHWH